MVRRIPREPQEWTSEMKADLLIRSYDLELIEPPCVPGADRWSAKAHLQDDIAAVLPYLNAELSGANYDPESKVLIWEDAGRKHAFRPDEIAAAPVVDKEEGREVIDGLVSLVNGTWKRRNEIEPSFRRKELPSVMDIYKFLPRTNCRECGYVTCMRFAVGLRQGETELSQCLCLPEENRRNLSRVLDKSE